jgi:DNA-damage-inducible protein D
LGYTKWDNFKNVIFKTKTACEVSKQEVLDHFAEVGKMVQIGSGASKEIEDVKKYKLSKCNISYANMFFMQ